MRRIARVLFWIAVVSLPAMSAPAVTVEIGIATAAPGEKISIPLSLSPGEEQATHISLEISFPSKLISFVEASKGAANESREVSIKAVSRPGDTGKGEDILRVEISSATPKPPGKLVQLAFQVSKQAELNDEINLKNLNVVVRKQDGTALEARGSDGLVTVLSGSLFACFFYMH